MSTECTKTKNTSEYNDECFNGNIKHIQSSIKELNNEIMESKDKKENICSKEKSDTIAIEKLDSEESSKKQVSIVEKEYKNEEIDKLEAEIKKSIELDYEKLLSTSNPTNNLNELSPYFLYNTITKNFYKTFTELTDYNSISNDNNSDELKKVLFHLKRTEKINLNDKKLTTTKGLEVLTSVEQIYLQRNLIKELSYLPNTNNLMLLNLHNNYLDEIPTILKDCSSLKLLNLSDNMILKLELSLLPQSLEYFYFYDNLFFTNKERILEYRILCVKNLNKLKRLDGCDVSFKEKFLFSNIRDSEISKDYSNSDINTKSSRFNLLIDVIIKKKEIKEVMSYYEKIKANNDKFYEDNKYLNDKRSEDYLSLINRKSNSKEKKNQENQDDAIKTDNAYISSQNRLLELEKIFKNNIDKLSQDDYLISNISNKDSTNQSNNKDTSDTELNFNLKQQTKQAFVEKCNIRIKENKESKEKRLKEIRDKILKMKQALDMKVDEMFSEKHLSDLEVKLKTAINYESKMDEMESILKVIEKKTKRLDVIKEESYAENDINSNSLLITNDNDKANKLDIDSCSRSTKEFNDIEDIKENAFIDKINKDKYQDLKMSLEKITKNSDSLNTNNINTDNTNIGNVVDNFKINENNAKHNPYSSNFSSLKDFSSNILEESDSDEEIEIIKKRIVNKQEDIDLEALD